MPEPILIIVSQLLFAAEFFAVGLHLSEMSEWGVSLPQFASTLMDYGAYLGKTRANPNRRSSQYKRQPPFEGSVRQVRGRVLSYRVRNGATLTSTLYGGLDLPPDRIDPVIISLAAEGFIIVNGDTVKIT